MPNPSSMVSEFSDVQDTKQYYGQLKKESSKAMMTEHSDPVIPA